MHEVCQGLSELASLFIIIRHNAWQEAHASPILLLIIFYGSEKINLLLLLHLFVQVLEACFTLDGGVTALQLSGDGVSFVAFEHVYYYDKHYN